MTDPYIHPKREELLKIFGVTYEWANLRRRKYILSCIAEEEKQQAKFHTMLTTALASERWAVNELINSTNKKLDTLRNAHRFLLNAMGEYKRNKEKGNSNEHLSSNFVEYDREAIRKIPISRILKDAGVRPDMLGHGKEYYKCIFHNEKTASMVVNLEENYFKCFGCQQAGDVIKIYQQLQGTDFINSLKELSFYL